MRVIKEREQVLCLGMINYWQLGCKMEPLLLVIRELGKVLISQWDINKKFVDFLGILIIRNWHREEMMIKYLFGICNTQQNQCSDLINTKEQSRLSHGHLISMDCWRVVEDRLIKQFVFGILNQENNHLFMKRTLKFVI